MSIYETGSDGFCCLHRPIHNGNRAGRVIRSSPAVQIMGGQMRAPGELTSHPWNPQWVGLFVFSIMDMSRITSDIVTAHDPRQAVKQSRRLAMKATIIRVDAQLDGKDEKTVRAVTVDWIFLG